MRSKVRIRLYVFSIAYIYTHTHIRSPIYQSFRSACVYVFMLRCIYKYTYLFDAKAIHSFIMDVVVVFAIAMAAAQLLWLLDGNLCYFYTWWKWKAKNKNKKMKSTKINCIHIWKKYQNSTIRLHFISTILYKFLMPQSAKLSVQCDWTPLLPYRSFNFILIRECSECSEQVWQTQRIELAR